MLVNELHYAVVVGIQDYPGITNLKSPLRDAHAVYRWLLRDGGLPPGNIERVMTCRSFEDVLEARPTRDEVNKALRRVNRAVSGHVTRNPLDREKTRLYFYVSGHGIAQEGSEAAVLMANAGEEGWGENIPCAAYLRRYEECQYFREVVMFADCCRLRRPADFYGPTFSANADVNIGPVDGFLGFATQLGDAAYEPTDGASPDEARSYFTQAVLEGLGGAAADERGEINTTTLAKYVAARVIKLTEKKRYPQVPKMPVDLRRPIVFRPATIVAVKRRHQVTLAVPADFVGGAVLLDGRLAQIGRFETGNGRWETLLEDGLYQVRPETAFDVKVFRNKGLFEVRGGEQHVEL